MRSVPVFYLLLGSLIIGTLLHAAEEEEEKEYAGDMETSTRAGAAETSVGSISSKAELEEFIEFHADTLDSREKFSTDVFDNLSELPNVNPKLLYDFLSDLIPDKFRQPSRCQQILSCLWRCRRSDSQLEYLIDNPKTKGLAKMMLQAKTLQELTKKTKGNPKPKKRSRITKNTFSPTQQLVGELDDCRRGNLHLQEELDDCRRGNLHLQEEVDRLIQQLARSTMRAKIASMEKAHDKLLLEAVKEFVGLRDEREKKTHVCGEIKKTVVWVITIVIAAVSSHLGSKNCSE